MDLMAMFGEANADTARCHGGGCHYDIRSYDNGNITCRRGVPPWRSPTWQTSRCFCCVATLAHASGSMPLAASGTSSRACCWKVPRPTPSSHWPQPGTASRSFPRMRKCRAARSVRCRSFTAGYRSENGRSSRGTPSGSWRRMPRSSSRRSWPNAGATIRVAISSDAHHHCPGQRYEQQSRPAVNGTSAVGLVIPDEQTTSRSYALPPAPGQPSRQGVCNMEAWDRRKLLSAVLEALLVLQCAVIKLATFRYF